MKVAMAALAAATLFAAAFTGIGALAAEEPSEDTVSWRGGFDCDAAYEARDVVYYQGSSYVAREAMSGCVTPREGAWDLVVAGGEAGSTGPLGQTGADGAAGPFDGKFVSPDGRFKITITNSGISLAGPQASVELGENVVKVDGVGAVVRGANTEFGGAGATNLVGPLVSLGQGCTGLARAGDMVTGTFNFTWYPPGPSQQPWPDGPMSNGRVMLGSQVVKAC